MTKPDPSFFQLYVSNFVVSTSRQKNMQIHASKPLQNPVLCDHAQTIERKKNIRHHTSGICGVLIRLLCIALVS